MPGIRKSLAAVGTSPGAGANTTRDVCFERSALSRTADARKPCPVSTLVESGASPGFD
jgi:hypothetical protein